VLLNAFDVSEHHSNREEAIGRVGAIIEEVGNGTLREKCVVACRPRIQIRSRFAVSRE
jgi:hypothetical protein